MPSAGYTKVGKSSHVSIHGRKVRGNLVPIAFWVAAHFTGLDVIDDFGSSACAWCNTNRAKAALPPDACEVAKNVLGVRK